MKLNLLFNAPGDCRSGYLNLDHAPQQGSPATKCDVTKLGEFVDANEVVELVACDLLDAFPANKVDEVLDHWLSRLAHKGQITISVVDVQMVAKAYLVGKLKLDDVNVLVHGEQDAPGHFRQCSLTMDQLIKVLEHKKLKVLKKRTENFRAFVTAERP